LQKKIKTFDSKKYSGKLSTTTPKNREVKHKTEKLEKNQPKDGLKNFKILNFIK